MLTRLAILFAVLGQLVSSGLCGAVCGPLSSAIFDAPDSCCVAPPAPTTEANCCEVEPAAPVSCCGSEPWPIEPVPASPDPCQTCAMPCCSALPPVVPATTTSTTTGAVTWLFLAPLPVQWAPDQFQPSARFRTQAAGPPGARTCHDRLASLCVWVI